VGGLALGVMPTSLVGCELVSEDVVWYVVNSKELSKREIGSAGGRTNRRVGRR
jgi:hypothetical protein